jgi:hypothetical protein
MTEFTCAMMFSYFNKCLLDNALEDWWLLMPNDNDQAVKTLSSLLKIGHCFASRQYISYTERMKTNDVALFNEIKGLW